MAGYHVDATNGRDDVAPLLKLLSAEKVLCLGVINGRNIWKTDLNAVLDWLEPIAKQFGDRLWIAPSCWLQHVPVDLDSEQTLNREIKSWLAFAKQKLDELQVLATALNLGRSAVQKELKANQFAINGRRWSTRVHSAAVKTALSQITSAMGQRKSSYSERSAKQAPLLQLPKFRPRRLGHSPRPPRSAMRVASSRQAKLTKQLTGKPCTLKSKKCVGEQEKLGLDVLVHGEAERNDMVEYFGEQLDGYAFSQVGWVQSYGSRCVKPPILFGDISRPRAMTAEWISYAQCLISKPMKGMLTGPLTILSWSFVRDDQPRSVSCRQLALAIREEVLDLEKAGIRIIQIDEAALREGLPLRSSQWQEYLGLAVECFRIAANGVSDETQIHTHMCYSEFNDIIAAHCVHGRGRHHHRNVTFGHGASRRVRQLQIPERDRARRVRYPFAQYHNGRPNR